ncbi:C40 family peptidase [Geomonas sp. Red32]|uniref:C40 family peptidase n=1 Tax=Geomonas sp. Red32 TaxID=2912856 RepID=UPI00202CDB8F|nr:C40 family peptidase [Geomonas sp. Red32]MCM0082530.1 C40 family peptidase [Geomonas sp. Red32]
MKVDPLQVVSTVPFPAAEAAGSRGQEGRFQALLDSVGAGETASLKPEQVAAEMLRIEMMQSTLSIGGGDHSAVTGGSVLESWGRGLPRNFTGWQTASGPVPLPPAGEQPAEPVGSGVLAGAGDPTGIEATAERFLGTPYRFGGEGGDGIDCSSFVQQVFREHQVDLPRTAREQAHLGEGVPLGELKKGDLLFFHTYASYPSHVGIYLGDGKMIHASSGKGEVTVSDINSSYYQSRFMGARRVV